jgi:hypothetical protein
MSESTTQKTPKSVILRGISTHGPLELEIPIQVLGEPGETIHQLAAKKAVGELEEGRGWLYDAEDLKGNVLKTKYPGRFDELVEREAVRLGVQFQVGGKFCSFVAVEKKEKATDTNDDATMSDKDYDFLDMDSDRKTLAEDSSLERGEHLDLLVESSAAPSRKFKKSVSRGGSFFGALSKGFGGSSAASPAPAPPPPQAAMSLLGMSAPSYSSAPGGSPVFGGLNAGGGFGNPLRRRDASQKESSVAQFASPKSMPAAAPKVRLSASSTADRQAPTVALAPPLAPILAPMDNNDDGFVSSDGNETLERCAAQAPELKKKKETSPLAPLPVISSFASRKVPSAATKDPQQALVELQTFEGFWVWTPAICAILGVEKSAIDSKYASIDKNVLATALTVRYFEVKLAKDKDGWEMIVEKAKGWLEGVGHDEDDAIWGVVKGIIA